MLAVSSEIKKQFVNGIFTPSPPLIPPFLGLGYRFLLSSGAFFLLYLELGLVPQGAHSLLSVCLSALLGGLQTHPGASPATHFCPLVNH